MLAWARESATGRARQHDDGAVFPPYFVPYPLARTAGFVEGRGLAPVSS